MLKSTYKFVDASNENGMMGNFPPKTLHPVAPRGNHGHSYSINLNFNASGHHTHEHSATGPTALQQLRTGKKFKGFNLLRDYDTLLKRKRNRSGVSGTQQSHLHTSSLHNVTQKSISSGNMNQKHLLAVSNKDIQI
jgi:hypothetical protein